MPARNRNEITLQKKNNRAQVKTPPATSACLVSLRRNSRIQPCKSFNGHSKLMSAFAGKRALIATALLSALLRCTCKTRRSPQPTYLFLFLTALSGTAQLWVPACRGGTGDGSPKESHARTALCSTRGAAACAAPAANVSTSAVAGRVIPSCTRQHVRDRSQNRGFPPA
jgi:hypothetical protein